MTYNFDSDATHVIFYEYDVDDRNYWECQTCSSAGSVPAYRDPEIAAELSHHRHGIYQLSTTNKRRWT